MTATGSLPVLGRKICNVCKKNLARKGRLKCSTCSRGGVSRSSRSYTKHKKDYCENPACTATIVDAIQLTVDHMDGNNNNNDPANLKTLCHNCHALKTHDNRDFLNIKYRTP